MAEYGLTPFVARIVQRVLGMTSTLNLTGQILKRIKSEEVI